MPIYNVTSQWGGGGGGANLYKGGEPYSIKTWGGEHGVNMQEWPCNSDG